MHQHKARELTGEEKALIAKFELTSFGQLRKDLIDAIEEASHNNYGLTNAIEICAKIKIYLNRKPAATPAELFQQLSAWLNEARNDEGLGKGSRYFINKLVDVFVSKANLMIDSMSKRELASLDAPAPQSAQSVRAQPQDQSAHIKQLEDLRGEMATLKASNTALEIEKGSLNSKLGAKSSEMDTLIGINEDQKSELTQLRKTNQESALTLESNKLQLEHLRQTVKTLEELRDKLSREADADRTKIREQSETISTLTISNAQLKATDSSKDSSIAQLKEDSVAQKARIEKLESELQQLRLASLQSTSENATLKARLEAAEKARDKSTTDLEAVRSEKESIAVQKATIGGKLEATEKAHGDAVQREERTFQEYRSATSRLEQSFAVIHDAGTVIRRLEGKVVEEERVTVLDESVADISAASRKALGLGEASFREPRRSIKTKPQGNQAQAAGQTGMFKTPSGNGVKAQPPVLVPLKDATPQQALDQLKPKIVNKDALSDARFNAVSAIAQFVTNHLTEKGNMKADANKTLYSLLIDAIKSLVNNTAPKQIAAVYEQLVNAQPAETDPLNNAFRELVAKLAVNEPEGENLQTPSMYMALTNFFNKVYFIKDLNGHYGAIYKSLNSTTPATGIINTSTSDVTHNTTNFGINGGSGPN